jgi:fatty acid desaturase
VGRAAFVLNHHPLAETLETHAGSGLDEQDILQHVHRLRQTDNWTNWYYLAREYLFLMLIIGGTVLLFESFWEGAHSLLWAIPVTFVSILCVGAEQHRLATLGHEAAHYMLFKNSLLNELASEWFCMFPILATTHRYRLQHFGHHQHTNDAELDPDVTQLRLSGHRFAFPLTLRQFLWQCFFAQLLWLPNLLRYVLVRATFHFERGSRSLRIERPTSICLMIIGAAYYLALTSALVYGVWTSDGAILFGIPGVLLTVILMILARTPSRWFPDYSLKCDLPERWRSLLHFTFNTIVLCGLTWLTHYTGKPWWLYYFLLWLVPAGTSFAFFMMLGQVAQHGNAGHDRLTNTRVFLVHPVIRFAVFPIGNDYHVPHHLFMNVPHYNLPQMHAWLMQIQEYRQRVTIVTGYFFHDSQPPLHPTVVDLVTAADTEPSLS